MFARSRIFLAASALVLLAGSMTACGSDDDDVDPTATTGAAATATPSDSAPSVTPSAEASAGPDAPSEVTLEGALPDLNTPVPPGGGELGRLTISWTDNSDDEQGFRVYQECDGVESVLLEVPRDETSYGPFQTCRPGRVGVAAYNAEGESEIAWAE